MTSRTILCLLVVLISKREFKTLYTTFDMFLYLEYSSFTFGWLSISSLIFVSFFFCLQPGAPFRLLSNELVPSLSTKKQICACNVLQYMAIVSIFHGQTQNRNWTIFVGKHNWFDRLQLLILINNLHSLSSGKQRKVNIIKTTGNVCATKVMTKVTIF